MHSIILINSEHPVMININSVVFAAWLRNLLIITEYKCNNLSYIYPLYKLFSHPALSFENYIDRINIYYAPIQRIHSQKSILPFIYASFLLILYIENNQECLSENSFHNIYKIFSAAFQLSAKLFYDEIPNSNHAANVFGINTTELQTLEWDFFARIKGDVRTSTYQINQLTVDYLCHLQLSNIPRPIVRTTLASPNICFCTDVRQLAPQFHP